VHGYQRREMLAIRCNLRERGLGVESVKYLLSPSGAQSLAVRWLIQREEFVSRSAISRKVISHSSVASDAMVDAHRGVIPY